MTMSEPMTTSEPKATRFTARPHRGGMWWTGGSLLALVVGIGVFTKAMLVVDQVESANHRGGCDAIVRPFPGYVLLLGWVSTVLLAVAAVLALVACRRTPPRSVETWRMGMLALVGLTILGTVFVAWLGVYSVITDPPSAPHCYG